MSWLIDFWHYMFIPADGPWYTGQFWPNQIQWMVVTLPALFITFWRLERRHHRRHHELKQHVAEILTSKETP